MAKAHETKGWPTASKGEAWPVRANARRAAENELRGPSKGTHQETQGTAYSPCLVFRMNCSVDRYLAEEVVAFAAGGFSHVEGLTRP